MFGCKQNGYSAPLHRISVATSNTSSSLKDPLERVPYHDLLLLEGRENKHVFNLHVVCTQVCIITA